MYQAKFIVSERLAVDSIIGTSFMNHHVKEVMCQEQVVRLKWCVFTIFGQKMFLDGVNTDEHPEVR